MTVQEIIPFLDLVTPHRELKVELLEVLQQALRTASFIGGSMVENFEAAFSKLHDGLAGKILMYPNGKKK